MNYLSVLASIIAAAALIAHCEAVEAQSDNKTVARANVRNWAEGTIESVDNNGRLVVRGLESPYANNYFSAMKDYYSTAPNEREAQLRAIRDKYSNMLNYAWTDQHNDNFILNVSYPEDMRVFDESKRYGKDFTSWTFDNNTQPYHYNDLKTGDRVVVGFNNNNYVESIFLVNPIRRESLAPEHRQHDLGARAVRPAPVPNINPYTGMHMMNSGSNETNHMTGESKSGSDSGHIMNAGSNATNGTSVAHPFAPSEQPVRP